MILKRTIAAASIAVLAGTVVTVAAGCSTVRKMRAAACGGRCGGKLVSACGSRCGGKPVGLSPGQCGAKPAGACGAKCGGKCTAKCGGRLQ